MVFDTDLNLLHTWNGTAWSNGATAINAENLVLPYKDSVTTNNGVLDLVAIKFNGTENKRILRVENRNPSNTSSSVSAYTNSNAGGTAIYGVTEGTESNAGAFESYNTSNTYASLYAYATGPGGAGYFQMDNPSSTGSALVAITNSDQFQTAAVYGLSTGTGDCAGCFRINNAANTRSAMYSETNGSGPAVHGNNIGTGPAAVLSISQATNTSAALSISHAGTGNAITANRPIQATQFIGDGSLLTGLPSGTGWGLTGNSGTVDGTDFVGTTDNVPLTFRVFNQKAGRIESTLSGSTFFGYQAGMFNSVGSNAGVGYRALYNNTTGTGNTSLGVNALLNNTIGLDNTAIGANTNVSLANLTNATAIGANAIVNASNKIRLGDNNVTVIEGQVGFTAASDRRLKMNILSLSDGLDFVMKLKPVSYHMRGDQTTKLNWGFIAQDIESLVGPNNALLTVGGDPDRTLGLRYTDFIAPLVKAVQEQQAIIEDLKERIMVLEGNLESRQIKKNENLRINRR